MAGKTSSFFPFGGGPSICPGRVFAKQEILMTIAALVTRFEIDMIDWGASRRIQVRPAA
ncbi:hypothetical protein ETB97_000496 [Aspergillus alliaceus]|uniref:Cytochrome P450 n=1 Tax=Petromyces alliaceus TaxID=209559 RepID=A0A8H6E7B4_PETAA|nr:hypothetical protein ETB97_000496 [Aspergillus burnettii]